MRERGFEPEFPPEALAQAERVGEGGQDSRATVRDLRDLPWCSIDNDDSRDLDQLSVAEPLPDGRVCIRVAIADVDHAAPQGTPIDRHAALNTTSVYTPGRVFPMLPTRLSNDLTSLNADTDRLAIIIECIVTRDGAIERDDVYAALVRNQAHLVYDDIDAFLEGRAEPPVDARRPGIVRQLELQDAVATQLEQRRHEMGALDFEVSESRIRFDGDRLKSVEPDLVNRAKVLIENLMIASNGVVARFLDRNGSLSLRRVVKEPERWDRIVAIAGGLAFELPPTPDVLALSNFLRAQKTARPREFHELSHSIIRLVGAGEYVVDTPTTVAPGHFALAVKDYAHSTAPNRRYPDLVTQRLIHAVLHGTGAPYTHEALTSLADHCTRREDEANRVERQVRKAAAAMLVADRVGQRFDATVTGASPKGTYVRTMKEHIEGRVVQGGAGLDVGNRVTVRLSAVNVERGFIDFAV